MKRVLKGHIKKKITILFWGRDNGMEVNSGKLTGLFFFFFVSGDV